jgi:syntaxin 16
MAIRSLTDQFLEYRKRGRSLRDDSLVNMDGQDESPFLKSDKPHPWAISKKKIEDHFQEIRKKIQKLDDLTNDLPRFGGESEKQKEIDTLMIELRIVLQKCNIEIKEFGTGPLKLEEKVLRQNIQSYLAYQYEQLSVAFNRTQQEHSENISALVSKGISILPDDDDQEEEEDEYLVSGTFDPNLGQRYAKDRLREIKKIAKSLQEIKMMFMEISDMVTTQGTVLDRIDQNITSAEHDVTVGVTNLVETNTSEGTWNKCWLVFLILVVIFSVIIVIVIRNKRSNSV